MGFEFGAPKAGFGTTMSHMKQNLAHTFRKKSRTHLRVMELQLQSFRRFHEVMHVSWIIDVKTRKSVTPGRKILTPLEGMFKAIANLQSATAMLSSEIEFGRLPCQPMRDISWHSFKRWYRFLQRDPQIRFHSNKNQGICIRQFRHDPEKVRGRYRCVLRETNQWVLNFQKVIAW